MADTRNPREIVDISGWQPFDHPQYGSGAVREVTYIDGTIEKRWFAHGTGEGPDVKPDSGYLVSSTVDPDIRDKWTRSAPPAGTQRTPEQTRVDQATANKAEEDERERAYHRSLGHGNLTHAEYEAKLDKDAADARAQETQARADKNQERITAAQETQNQIARDRLQLDRDKQNMPTVKPETVNVGGIDYTKITRTDKNGNTEITYLGPDGKPIARLPSEGEVLSGGPPLPELVAGRTAEAGSAYLRALNEDKTLTTAEKARRWREFKEAADIVNNEATVLQRERESRRNAEYNTAATRLNAMQSGTQTALEFVSKMNGLLPSGSTQGGDAFAALMGLSMLQMHLSGIDSLSDPGTSAGQPATKLPTITAADMSNPQAVATKRAEVEAAAQTEQSRSAAPPAQSAAPGAASSVPRPAAPAVPASPAPMPAAPGVGVNPDAGQALGPTGNSGPLPTPGQNPDAGQGLGPTGDSGPLPPAPAAPPLPPPPASEIPYGPLPFGQTVVPLMPSADDTSGLPPTVRPNVLPEPGVTYPGTFTNEATPGGSGGNVQMAPQNDYPVLSMAQAPMPRPMQPQQQAAGGPEYPALLHSEAASRPFWQMSPEEVERYRAAGVPEDVIQNAGRRIA